MRRSTHENITRATITKNTADHIAEDIISENLEIPEIGLTRATIKRLKDLRGGVRGIAEAAMAGTNAEIAEKCLAAIQRRPHYITLQLLAILAEAKINAAAWLFIQEHVDHVILPGETQGGCRNIMSDNAKPHPTRDILTHEAHVHLGNNIYVVPTGLIDLPIDAIPDTLAHAAVGQPLAKVLSHPAIDGFGYMITGVYMHDEHIDFHFDDKKPDIALADLTQDLLWPTLDAVANIHRLAQQSRPAIAQEETQHYDERMTTTPEI